MCVYVCACACENVCVGEGGGGVRCGCVSSEFATDLCECDLCNYGIHYFFGILLKFNFCHNMLSLL